MMVISLFRMAPTHSAQVLSRVLKHKEAVVYLMEKILVLGKFCSDMSYGAVG